MAQRISITVPKYLFIPFNKSYYTVQSQVSNALYVEYARESQMLYHVLLLRAKALLN